MSAETALIQIVRCVLLDYHNHTIDDKVEWKSVISLAKKHGLLMYVYYFVNTLKDADRPDRESLTVLNRFYASAVRQDVLQFKAIREMRTGFERAGVDNVFIKGAVTKLRYKNELLRSMGDIDFLYKPEQDVNLKTAMTGLGFKQISNGRVHDSYVKDKSVLVEAHRALLPPTSRYAGFDCGIWKKLKLMPDCHHNFEMGIEDEIVFNTIHLASHFKKGGSGVRFIIDAWIYRQMDADWEYVESELADLGLDRFYLNIQLLANRWFGASPCENPTILAMEDYILTGGIFGSTKNRADAVIAGGKLSYLRKVLFPSFKDMQSVFPWLKKRILLPYAWMLRGAQSLVRRKKNVKLLLHPLTAGDSANSAKLAAFYNDCGL